MKLYEMIPISEFENYDVESKAKLNKEEENVEGWAKSISAFSNSGSLEMISLYFGLALAEIVFAS